ncbi:hypothetical protein WH47_07544 [Habropoda laboriosa]|uniref:Uncharacterized protein n=1 Tax=Habropoda laboriosa TaxID=597456 RepID=A0A0L7QQ80_9HYME|nr:hypothetical protein WH47_07544 [Habropoda laboriosa]
MRLSGRPISRPGDLVEPAVRPLVFIIFDLARPSPSPPLPPLLLQLGVSTIEASSAYGAPLRSLKDSRAQDLIPEGSKLPHDPCTGISYGDPYDPYGSIRNFDTSKMELYDRMRKKGKRVHFCPRFVPEDVLIVLSAVMASFLFGGESVGGVGGGVVGEEIQDPIEGLRGS